MENSLKPQPSRVQVLPDHVRSWVLRQKPDGFQGWWPATGAQQAALDCPADLLMLGGTLGSLKTSSILADLIQERQSPRMVSYFFRRTYPSLEDAIRQSRLFFPQTGALPYNSSDHTWRWPSGATFRFRHCKSEKDLYDNFGKEMSAIGIDQSEQFPEDYVRFLITRNRSVDKDLQIRIRLGANPGGEGGTWHTHVFFNGVCPHCEPHKAPPQGELRYDSSWRSDKVPIKLSVAYILSSVYQHNLLGADYIKRIEMQHPATAKALLEGCWRTFEGQYFDVWDYDRMVVPRASVKAQWWWNWWTGSDYGYSGSSAAAVLMARGEPEFPQWPNGRIFCVEEYPKEEGGARREPVREFAQNFYEAFAEKKDGDPQARKIQSNYLGPDSWNDRGDLHTLAGQMNEVLEPHGLGFERADNDRAGGAQLIYSMLQSGELVICDSCPNVIKAIESRLKDHKEPVKVQKVPTDSLDDVYDAFRYALYSYHQKARKPVDMRITERLEKIFTTDPTRAMMEAQMIRQQEQDSSKGEVYSGNARRRMQEFGKKG